MTPELQVAGQTNVFAIGDVADADLKTAARAGKGAEIVVANIRALIEGAELQAYEPMPPAIVIPLGPSGGASELPARTRSRVTRRPLRSRASTCSSTPTASCSGSRRRCPSPAAEVCSELDQELDRLALVHRAIAVGHLVEAVPGRRHGRARSAPRGCPASAPRCMRAPEPGRRLIVMLSKKVLRVVGIVSVLRHADATDRASRPGDAERGHASTASWPTHSRADWAPRPPVSSRTRSIASSPRSLTMSVAPKSCGRGQSGPRGGRAG